MRFDMDSSRPETNTTVFGDRRIDLIAFAVLMTAMFWAAPRVAVYWSMPPETAPSMESNNADRQ